MKLLALGITTAFFIVHANCGWAEPGLVRDVDQHKIAAVRHMASKVVDSSRADRRRWRLVSLDAAKLRQTAASLLDKSASEPAVTTTDFQLFPDAVYRVVINSADVDRYDTLAVIGYVDGRENSSGFMMSVGASGMCYGRLVVDDSVFVISPTKESPYHIVEDLYRSHPTRKLDLTNDVMDIDEIIEKRIDESLGTSSD